MALTAEDAKAAADVVGADMTVAADTGAVAMTKTDVVIAPQNTHTFRPDKCPNQDAVDRVKPSIVHRHVTGDRIFVDDNTYRNLMNATERHAVY